MTILRLANCAIGLWLIYTALLNPWIVAGPKSSWMTLAAGVALLLLAVITRRHELGTWQGDTVAVLALVLIGHTLLRLAVSMPLVLNTWLVFWIGVLSAVLSLWSVLYRSSPAEE